MQGRQLKLSAPTTYKDTAHMGELWKRQIISFKKNCAYGFPQIILKSNIGKKSLFKEYILTIPNGNELSFS